MKNNKRIAKRAGAAVLAAILAISGAMWQQTVPAYATYGYSLSASSEDNGLIADQNQDELIPDAESDDGLIPEVYPDDVVVPRTESDNDAGIKNPARLDEPAFDETENTYINPEINNYVDNYEDTGISQEGEVFSEDTDALDDTSLPVVSEQDNDIAGQESEPGLETGAASEEMEFDTGSSYQSLLSDSAQTNDPDSDTSEWYKDYTYSINNTNKTITITKYNGSATEIFVPGSTIIDGVSYKTILSGGVYYHKKDTKSIRIGKGCKAYNCNNMFRGCKNMITLDIGELDTSNVTNMSYMFYGCSKLEVLDISEFDTSNVTNMSHMLDGCGSLTSLDVSGFDTSSVTDMSYMFSWCVNLVSLDVSGFDTSNVTNMHSMFYVCEKLTAINSGNFDTSKVTDMAYVFCSCTDLTILDVSGFKTSNVTSMNDMFNSCRSLVSLDVSGFDTSKVTDMSHMFCFCVNLTVLDVSGFDTSKVTDMSHMFYYCDNLTVLDVSGFDTTYVTNMSGMFGDCSALTNLDVSGFDTSNVTDMSTMFSCCFNLKNLDVSGFNTSKVTDMRRLFYYCDDLTIIDVSGFDTTYVTDMSGMFEDCSALTNLDVSGFDTSNVLSMESMFYSCKSLTALDLSGFITSRVTDMGDMFSGCSGLTTLNVSRFDTSNVTNTRYMFWGCSGIDTIDVSSFNISKVTDADGMFSHCENIDLILSPSWNYKKNLFSGAIINTINYPGTVTQWKDFGYLLDKDVLIICSDGTINDDNSEWYKDYTYTIDSETKTITINKYNGLDIDIVVPERTSIKGVSYTTILSGSVFRGKDSISSIVINNGCMALECDSMFEGCSGLAFLDISGLDMSDVESAYKMFGGCTAVISLPFSWNYYDNVFLNAEIHTIYYPLTEEQWNSLGYALDESIIIKCSNETINEDSEGYKNYLYSINNNKKTLTITGYKGNDTEIVIPGSTSINGDIYKTILSQSAFYDKHNIRSVEIKSGCKTYDCSYMFYGCSNLTSVDISGLDTSRATSMSDMFKCCSSLTTMNISGLDTSSVSGMSEMFYGCKSLTKVDISGFDMTNVDHAHYMFYGCTIDLVLPSSWKCLEYVFSGAEIHTIKTSLTKAEWIKLGFEFDRYTVICSDGTYYEDNPEWYKNYSYEIDNKEKTIIIKKYNGSATEVIVPNKTEIDGISYETVLSGGVFHRRTDIVSIVIEAGCKADDCESMFDCCYGLTTLDVSGLDTSKVTSMSGMFNGCGNLTTLDVSKLDTSSVTNMSGMFGWCSGLTTLDVSGLDTSSVTDMSYIFSGCSGLTVLDVSDLDTSSVANMDGMFGRCSGLTTLDVSKLDTSSVTNMGGMFGWCSGLTILDVSGLDTSSVTEMSGIFSGCSGLTTLDVNGFDTSNVVHMDSMFSECCGLTALDVNGLDTSSVTDMSSMFNGCESLTTLDISGFNMLNVEDAGFMFGGCIEPCLPSSWRYLDCVFEGFEGYVIHYPLTMAQWESLGYEFEGSVKIICSDGIINDDDPEWYKDYSYTIDDDKKTIIINKYNGSAREIIVPGNTTIGNSFYKTILSGNVFEGKNDIVSIVIESGSRADDCKSMFNGCYGLTSLDVSGLDTSSVTDMNGMFVWCSGLTTLDVSKLNTSKVTDMSGMFAGCSGLTTLDISDLDTSSVTNMSWMFAGSGLATVDVSGLDTSKVTDMSGMFEGCSGLSSFSVGSLDTSSVTSMNRMFAECSELTTIDVSGLDTSSVTNMSGMFQECSELTTLDISGLDTSNVTDMSYIFSGCSGLTTLNVNSFDTSSAESMNEMFSGCSGLTALNVSGFDTSSVTDMWGMFYGCEGLTTVDVSSFDTSNTEIMGSMFTCCTELKTLDVSSFDTSSVTDMGDMFSYCPNLTTLTLGSFDTSNVEYLHSMFYGCTSLTTLDISSFVTKDDVSVGAMFGECTAELILPSSWTYFDDVFSDSEIRRIRYPQTKAQWNELGYEFDYEVIIICSDGVIGTNAPVITKELYNGSFVYRVGAAAGARADEYDHIMAIEAKGEGTLTYKWQYKLIMGVSGNENVYSDWIDCGTNNPRLSLTMSDFYDGALFRCTVMKKLGNGETVSVSSQEREVRVILGWARLDANGGVFDDGSGATVSEVAQPIYARTGYYDPRWFSYAVSREGSILKGWYTAPDKKGKEVVRITKDMTVYARWTNTALPEIRVVADCGESYKADQEVTFTAENKAGDQTGWKWQYSLDGKTWKAVSKGTTKSITVRMTKATYKNGATFRCTAWDDDDRECSGSVTVKRLSTAVTGVVVSTADSEGAFYMTGQPLTLTAAAEGGNKIKYEWFYQPAGKTEWISCGKKQTLKISKMTGQYTGAGFKCRATNDDGGWLDSDPVAPVHKQVTVTDAVIERTDAGFTGTDDSGRNMILYANGSSVTLKVNAAFSYDGAPAKTYKYNWVYSVDGGINWKSISGGKSDTVTIKKMTNKNYHKALIKCIVYALDQPGGYDSDVIYTECAVAKITDVEMDPAGGFEFFSGETKSIEIKKVVSRITGTGEQVNKTVKYSWEYNLNDGKGWKKCTKGTGAKLSMTMTAAYDGARFRCVLNNGEDTTDTWTLGYEIIADKKDFEIDSFNVTITPDDRDHEGVLMFKLNQKYTFNAVVSPEPVVKGTKYTWKYLPDGKADVSSNWKNITGGNKKELILTMKDIYDAALIKCEVQIPGEEVFESDPIEAELVRIPINDISVTTDGMDENGDFVYTEGETRLFRVGARSDKPMKYTWKYSTNGGRTWSNCKSGTKADLKLKMSFKGEVLIKCIITNGDIAEDSPVMTGTLAAE